MTTRTRSKSQTYDISTQFLEHVQSFFDIYRGPHLRWITKLLNQNDPKANDTKMIETKYVEIHDLTNKSTFRAALRTELLDSANMITARYALQIKSGEDKEERYNTRCFTVSHLDIMKD